MLDMRPAKYPLFAKFLWKFMDISSINDYPFRL